MRMIQYIKNMISWLLFTEFIWKSKVIVALDNMSEEAAVKMMSKLSEECMEYIDRIAFKFNDLLFKRWADWISVLWDTDTSNWFMLDPKFYDIPPTVEHYINQLKESGLGDNAEFITMHASGWTKMIHDAVTKRDSLWLKTKILAITALTSMTGQDTQMVFDETAKHSVLKLVKLALEAWADGIVCSPLEAPILRAVFWEKYPDFEIVCPWIRFKDATKDHQERIKEPKDAIRDWVSHLVIWSPITKAENPSDVMRRVFEQIDGVVHVAEKSIYKSERVRYSWTVVERLEYAWAIYVGKEWGTLCRLRNGRYSNVYLNIGAMERYYGNVEDFSMEMAQELEKELWWDEISASEIDVERNKYVVLWAQMWSVRISGVLAEKMWIEESIYTEKYSVKEQRLDDIEICKEMLDWWAISKETFTTQVLEILTSEEYKDKMILKRHDIDLTWKKVILSEDMVTKGTTLAKMIKLVKASGWEVVAIACVWNRYWKDNYEWIPLISCEKIDYAQEYWDESTLKQVRNDMEEDERPEGDIVVELERIRSEEIPLIEWTKVETDPKWNWSKLIWK